MLRPDQRYAIRAIRKCFCDRFAKQPQESHRHCTQGASTARALVTILPIHTLPTSQRSSAGLRSIVYLGGAVLIVQGIGPLLERASITEPAVVQIVLLSAGTTWTYALLCQEGRPLSTLPFEQRATQTAYGTGLGAAAFLAAAAAAGACGWLHTTGWGWQRADIATLVRSMIVRAITHAAYAWNEELVFRGYGYDLVQATLGPMSASLALTGLFAAYHQWRPQVLFGEAALGLALLALRIKSGDIWLPIGYHFAWNFIQTGILGPADGPVSILPLQVTGPYLLIGRPGYPEPGLLMASANLLVALAIAFSQWREKKTS